jgi:L-alanine-DL-glutamate epimerase-like enolase superfamily enzyme
MIVTVETDAGITGIGEGGSPRHRFAVGRAGLIRRDPQYIEKPRGRGSGPFSIRRAREKTHGIGAFDLALCGYQG